jgi:hypothetical protein
MAKGGIQSGHPKFSKDKQPKGRGRPRVSPAMKAARRLTKTAFEEILNRFIHMSDDELKDAKRAPERTQLERIVIAILEKAEAWGDQGKLNFVLARLIGNVSETINVSGLDTPADAMTPKQREARIAALLAARDKVHGKASK